MPYIVTTKQRGEQVFRRDPEAMARYGTATEGRKRIVSRRAVATLDEARHEADGALADCVGVGPDDTELRWQALYLPEQGGTVGPLPDGTVIEVERVMLSTAFFKAAGLSNFDTPHMSDAAIIDAYNAAQD